MTALTQRPGRLDLEVVRGDAASVRLTFVNAAGAPVNLAGRTLQLRVRVAGRPVEVNLDSGVDNGSAAAGIIELALPATATTVDRARWYLRDHTNNRTLLDGDLRALPVGLAGAGSGSIETTVVITNATAEVTVTAAVVGPPGEGGGGGGGGFTQAQIEEFARDALAAALVAGANITITPNDAGNTITIAGAAATVDVVSNVATATILGRATSGPGNSEELSPAQVRGLLDVLTAGEVSALLDALIGAAPGSLDTLNELAAALGDDPNFAATVTAALAGKQPLDPDLTAIAALTTTVFGRSLLTLADAAAARSLLGLVIGTDVQAADADLAAIAALSTTVFGRSLLALADLPALRTVLAASGTPSASTYLRGDGTWATPAGGGSTEVPAVGPVPDPGEYVSAVVLGATSATNATLRNTLGNANNSLLYWPVFVPPSWVGLTFSEVHVSVQAASGAGSTLRIGVYAAAADRLPGAELAEFGTVAIDSTGAKSITGLSFAFTESGVHYFAGVGQNLSGTNPAFHGHAATAGIASVAAPTAFPTTNPGSAQINETGVTAGLPATATPVVNTASTGAGYPWIKLRRAP